MGENSVDRVGEQVGHMPQLLYRLVIPQSDPVLFKVKGPGKTRAFVQR